MKQTVIDIALEQIYQAIVKSKNPDALTKRTGEYRIGLRKAMDILSELKEMEKEQMRDVWDESRSEYMGDNYIGKEKSFEDYYNEIFNTKEK